MNVNTEKLAQLRCYMKEPSTLRGLVWLATAAGLQFSEADVSNVIELAMLAVGLLGMLPDKKAPCLEPVDTNESPLRQPTIR